MIRFISLVAVMLTCFTNLPAQRKRVVKVNAGENVMDIIPAGEAFFYPGFTQGKVFFKNGRRTDAALNYSLVVDEIHFIAPKGDTMALDNEESVAYIAIGNDIFYYDKGYLRLLSSGGSVKLALKQVWIVAETRQIGAYNTSNPTASIVSYKSLIEGGRLYDLIVNADVILHKVEHFYIGDIHNRFLPANRKNLLKLFPEKQDVIETYLKRNKVDFSDRDSLDKIIQTLKHS